MSTGDPSYSLKPEEIEACKNSLEKYLPSFLEVANEELKTYGISDDDLLYYSYALQYNIQGGKMLRALMLVVTVKVLAKGLVSNHLWNQTLTLAWCIELLQSSFLVADDIMDQSKIRRSNACWYLVPTIGVENAINDAMFLYALIYRILLKVFKDHHYLTIIIDTFSHVSMRTILGQHMDTYSSKQQAIFDKDYEVTELFNRICKNKTSYYTFYLPFKLGMLLSNFELTNLYFKKIETISILFGLYFQSRDDYLDCYGTCKESGKDGTDIQTSKCTWLLSTALEIASEEQENDIRNNLGKSGDENINVVKKTYNDLKLPKLFTTYTNELINEIKSKIDVLKHEEMRIILNWTLELLINQ